MALTRPFQDTIETPQMRKDNPKKYWANVIVAAVLLPLAVGGVGLSFADLWSALHQQGR